MVTYTAVFENSDTAQSAADMSNSNSTVGAGPWTVPELPSELFGSILRFVPVQQRLGNHALVCKAWATAAAKVTDSIDLTIGYDASNFKGLQPWINQHVEQLTSIELSYQPYPKLELQLPCAGLPQLRTLKLIDIFIKLPPAHDGVAGSAAATSVTSASSSAASIAVSSADAGREARRPLLPALQRLKLFRCRLDTVADMLQLARSTALTSLQLQSVDFLETDETVDKQRYPTPEFITSFNAGVSTMLQQLPGLHSLELGNGLARWGLDQQAVCSITAMSSLKNLHVKFGASESHGSNPSDAPLALPHGLTKLELGNSSGTRPVDIMYPAYLASLQDTLQLQELALSSCSFSPAVLSRLTCLQKLSLEGCDLLPALPAAVNIAAAGVRELLGSIGKLTQLQGLSLAQLDWDVEDTDPQLFAALTAAGALTSLELIPVHHQPLPLHATQHMFRLGRMLQLRVLRINCDDGEYYEFDVRGDGWCLDAGDLEQIIAACPQLECFSLVRDVDPGASLDALLQLPNSLSELFVGGMAFGDAAAAAVAKLQNLSHLVWTHSPGLSDVGLQRLTALTGLTYLHVWTGYCSGLSANIFAGCEVAGEDTVDLCACDQKGPVWQQLQDMCINSPACRSAAVVELREENA